MAEIINKRKKYIEENIEDKDKICCDDKLFKNYINRLYLLNEDKYKEKILNLHTITK